MSSLIYSCSDRVFQISMPNHGRAHEWQSGKPGSDLVNFHPRMFSLLRTTAIATSVLVNVSVFYYLQGGAYVVFPGGTYNLTSHIPTTPNYTRLVLLGLDTLTNQLTAYNGAEAFNSALTPPPLPTGVPSTFIPSSLIRVKYNATEISELDISDARIFLGGTGGSSAGWQFENVLTVSTLESNAGYSSVADALVAASAGDVLLLEAENFAAGTLSTSTVVLLRGWMAGTSIISGTLTTTAAIRLEDVTVSDITASTTPTLGCSGLGQSILAYRARIGKQGVGGSGNITALDINYSGGTSELHECEISARNSGGTRIGLRVQTGTVHVYGGALRGTDYALQVESGATVYLYGPVILEGTINNLGTVRGWYYDSAGNVNYVDGSGTNSGVWLVDESASVRVKYSTLAAAISAAATGDVIELEADTYTVTGSALSLNKSIAIIGQGIGRTIITSALSNNPTIDVSADNVTFRNLTIQHTGTGSTAGPLSTDNINLVLDNVYLDKTSGASTTSYGLWMYGGSVAFKNGTQISCTAGTNKYGILNDTADTTITIFGGQIGGDTQDIYTARAGSVLNISNCWLTNNLLSWAGIINDQARVSKLYESDFGGAAWSTNTSGQLSGVVGVDIQPNGDGRGLATRFITPIAADDHFTSGSIPSGYTWAASSGYFSGTPTISAYNQSGSYMWALGSGVYFLQRAVTNAGANWQNKRVSVRCSPRNNSLCGILIDNGNSATNQPYVRFYLEDNANGTMTPKISYKNTVGGAVTTTSGQVMPWGFASLLIVLGYGGGTYQFYCYLWGEDGNYTYLGLTTGAVSWMPVEGRAGLFLSGANNYSSFDWFTSEFN